MIARSRPSEAARTIMANLGWLLASRGATVVLSLFYLAIATRTLGVKDFGRFALITGGSQALATLVGFQTWQVVVRFGVDLTGKKDNHRLARLIRICLQLDLASAVTGVALAAVIVFLAGDLINIRAEHTHATFAYAVVQLITLRSTAVGVLRLRDRFSWAAVADSVTPAMRLLGAFTAALVQPTVIGFLMGWAVAEVATALVYWAMLLRSGDLRQALRRDQHAAAPEGLLRFMLTTNLASTLGLSTKQLPLLIVGGTGGVAAAGAFRLALQIAQGLSKLAQMVSRAAFPEIMRHVRTADAEKVVRTALRGLGAASLGGVVVLAVITASGHWLLDLIGGPQFVRAYPALVWLAAAGCVDLAVVGFEPILFGAGRSGAALIVRALAVALQIATTILLLPMLDNTAAAIGVFVASVSSALLLIGAVVSLRRGRPAISEPA